MSVVLGKFGVMNFKLDPGGKVITACWGLTCLVEFKTLHLAVRINMEIVDFYRTLGLGLAPYKQISGIVEFTKTNSVFDRHSMILEM